MSIINWQNIGIIIVVWITLMEKFPKNANVIFYFLNHLTAASEIQGLRTVEIKKVSCSMIWNVSGTVFVDVGSCVY